MGKIGGKIGNPVTSCLIFEISVEKLTSVTLIITGVRPKDERALASESRCR